jgi:hypothetical protein
MSDMARRGSLLVISEGSYSSYSVNGFFVVLQDFSPIDMRDAYCAMPPKQTGYGTELVRKYDGDGFVEHLISSGFLLQIRYDTLHLTDYGDMLDTNGTDPVFQFKQAYVD